MRNDPIALDCAYKVCVRKCKKSKIDIQQNKLNYIYSTFHCSMFLLGKAFFAFRSQKLPLHCSP